VGVKLGSIVYAGVVDRIDTSSVWNDLHWQLEKVQLLQQEVEQALGCDGMGLVEPSVSCRSNTTMCTLFNPSCNKWGDKGERIQILLRLPKGRLGRGAAQSTCVAT
jgi:hypothetical protein